MNQQPPQDPGAGWEHFHERPERLTTAAAPLSAWEELLDTVVPGAEQPRSVQEHAARGQNRRPEEYNHALANDGSLSARRTHHGVLPPHFSDLSPFSPPLPSNQHSSYFPEHYVEQYNPQQQQQRSDEYNASVSGGGQYGPPQTTSPRPGANHVSFSSAYPTPYSNPSPLLPPTQSGSVHTPPSPYLPPHLSSYAVDTAQPNDRVREWLGPAGGAGESRESVYAETRQDGWSGRDENRRDGVDGAEPWRRYMGLPAHAEFAARIPTFPFMPLQGAIPSPAQNFGPLSPQSPYPPLPQHQRPTPNGPYHLNPQWTTTPPLPPPPYDYLYPYDNHMLRERFAPQTSYFDPQNAPHHQDPSHDDLSSKPSAEEDAGDDFIPPNRTVVASTSKRGRKPVTRREPSESISSDEQQPLPKRKQKKMSIELDCLCANCGVHLARLILRGKAHELSVPHSPYYTCVSCSQKPAHSPERSRTSSDGSSEPLLSASAAPLPPAGKQARRPTSTSFRKRTKRGEDSTLTACDVCLREIMTGDVLADDSRATVDFAVEVICTQCSERYKRCTDCGGGGGARLGVGKWRSKELFAEGRRTCVLSHLRLGALSDMFYDVWPVALIPEDEMDELTSRCKAIFQNTLLSGMCTPEVFETQSAIAKSFTEAKKMSEDGWRMIEPMMRIDIEDTKSIRRYAALRFCSPNPRKNNRAKVAAEAAKPQDNSKCLRSNKDLVGFILAEYDLLLGSLFVTVVVPWATGESYDATTLLFQALLGRAAADRASLNVERAQNGLTAYPPIIQVWTMMFFKRDTRMMNHLTKKRGFVTLEDYMKTFADANPAAFPPFRSVYIPDEFQQGWQVMVRRQSGEGADDWTPRKGAEHGRNKGKEQRAQARRRGD